MTKRELYRLDFGDLVRWMGPTQKLTNADAKFLIPNRELWTCYGDVFEFLDVGKNDMWLWVRCPLMKDGRILLDRTTTILYEPLSEDSELLGPQALWYYDSDFKCHDYPPTPSESLQDK